jgi:hypothetical protein
MWNRWMLLIAQGTLQPSKWIQTLANWWQ